MNEISTDQLSGDAIMYMIHHIFLPSQLPQEDDTSSQYETFMVDITIKALRKFKSCHAEHDTGAIDSVINMVNSLKAISDTFDTVGTVNEKKLFSALGDLARKGGIVLLHIRAQNAGVMISEEKGSIHIEVFELSPLNRAVLTTKGRLRRSFPGCARALSIDVFGRHDFQATVAQTLSKMSHQPAVGTKPQVKKAGSKHDENRDSTHPKMVTELFVGFLSAIGEAVKVTPLFKNTREEVMWSDALLPWRRSPLWMLLRVSMQLVFSRWQDMHELPAEYYKTFMVFLMGEVLQLSLGHNIPSDLLYAMNAKLGRRLLKLDPSVPRAGLPVVHGVMHRAAGLIRTRWKEIQNQASPFHDLSTLESLDFDHDAVAGLDSLAELVDSPSSGAPGTAAACFRPTSLLIKFPPEVLPACPRPSGEYAWYELKAFEAWVASGLSRWGKSHEGDDSTCAKISALIVTYYQTASPLYAGDPESLSVLLLTVIELWIVCDRSALHLCGLLKDYDPGIPHDMLQSLVLPSKSQMERLLRAEDYLRDRRTRAVHACPSVFRHYGRATCFGVRYFDVSAEHQRLRQDIERHAAQTKLEKVNELRRKKDEYNALMKLHDQASCQFIDVIVDHEYDVRERQHSRACRKCDYRSRAASIAIHVHEWPLPNNSLEAKSTVFELKLPPFFAQWRDTAFFLLTEVFNAESQVTHRPRANHPLQSYQGLSSYFTAAFSGQRLVLLSEVKPHGVTHRRARPIGVTDEIDICVNNGLSYRYYDDARGHFVDDLQVGRICQSILLRTATRRLARLPE